MLKRFLPWIAWSFLMIAMIAYLTSRLRGPDRRVFLPGETSHGHYQIELACNACHTPGMGVREKACIDCHGAELKLANDSHPESKFTDPRNADRLKMLAAHNCVTCHREHLPEQTRSMGVTLPDDYCYHCHQETLQERPSHRGFGFNTCATAGCHNYHDNTALYEAFLVKHANEPKIKERPVTPARNLLQFLIASERKEQSRPLSVADEDAPVSVKADAPLLHAWETTAHAKAGVNCSDCHLTGERASKRWTDKPDHTACASCHKDEVAGFFGGKHGMRLARALSPMKPALARLPMKPEAAHREMSCVSCHGAHEFDTRKAAVESCLSCHNDAHSLAYKNSAHFDLWQEELSGRAFSGSAVTCATCHLPRETHKVDELTRIVVQHNQNANLRPNEKMIRGVCLDCHGLAFSMDSLADRALIQSNFTGRPARHIESIDLALRRLVKPEAAKPKH